MTLHQLTRYLAGKGVRYMALRNGITLYANGLSNAHSHRHSAVGRKWGAKIARQSPTCIMAYVTVCILVESKKSTLMGREKRSK